MATRLSEESFASRHRDAPAGTGRVVRTLIVDDHELVAGAIEATLRQLADFGVVGVATTIEAGVATTAKTTPDLLVTDLLLGDGNVADHLHRFHAAAPSLRVLVMSGNASEGAVMQALRAGANGFVTKAQPLIEVVAAARRVAAGEVVLPAVYMRTLLERGGVLLPTIRRAPALTPREVDVLQLLALGRTTIEVAGELRLAVNTIRNHLAGAMSKLGVGNRLGAVVEAVRLGIVSPPAPVGARS